jgi:hypothetical protein
MQIKRHLFLLQFSCDQFQIFQHALDIYWLPVSSPAVNQALWPDRPAYAGISEVARWLSVP